MLDRLLQYPRMRFESRKKLLSHLSQLKIWRILRKQFRNLQVRQSFSRKKTAKSGSQLSKRLMKLCATSLKMILHSASTRLMNHQCGNRAHRGPFRFPGPPMILSIFSTHDSQCLAPTTSHRSTSTHACETMLRAQALGATIFQSACISHYIPMNWRIHLSIPR